MEYDMIVIGAGPAGVSAAVYAASRGKRILLLEKGEVGGLIGRVSTVTHYAGILPDETGESFARRLKQQVLTAGVELRQEEVRQVHLTGSIKEVITDRAHYQAPRLVLANGCHSSTLGIPGEKELTGRGIGLNAQRDGRAYQDKSVYVVGGADGAVKEALYLARFARTVTLIHCESALAVLRSFGRRHVKPRIFI